ncbi:LysE family translocator [Jeotgalibacillus marinus]|uniref:LysE family translocator n=1 Tax=Jeotgalibacillus marinus TaxID=86667 RepID=A0ABV3Q524_9BACL
MHDFLMFVVLSIFLVILPGPDTVLVIQGASSRGKKEGLRTVFGITTGVLVHTSAAVLGLSIIIVNSSFLFETLKFVGAVYLVYIGVSTLIASRKRKNKHYQAQKKPFKLVQSGFKKGLVTNVVNPKVAVFFLTFLPQFINVEKGSFLQFLGLGLTYCLLTFIWFCFVLYLIKFIKNWMNRPSTQSVIERVSGSVLVIFGLKLAFEKQP